MLRAGALWVLLGDIPSLAAGKRHRRRGREEEFDRCFIFWIGPFLNISVFLFIKGDGDKMLSRTETSSYPPFPPPCLTENKYKERNNQMEDMKVKTWCSERHPETHWRKTTWSPLLPFLLVLPLRLPSVSLLCCGFSSCNNMSHVHITEWRDNSVCVCWCKH